MKKKIVSLLFFTFLFMLPISMAVTFDTWNVNIKQGQWETKSFTLYDSNITTDICTFDVTGNIEDFVVNMPNMLDFTNQSSYIINPYIVIEDGTTVGDYNGYIRCINGSDEISIPIYLTVSGTETKKCIDSIKATPYTTGRPGSKISFYVYNTTDGKGVVAKIRIKSTIPSIADAIIDCDGLSTTDYEISPNERNYLLAFVDVPGCGSLPPIEIPIVGSSTTGDTNGGEIKINVNNEYNKGEAFHILVIANNEPLKFGEVSIVGPESYTFEGITNNMGIVASEDGTKIFGTDIKPDKLGEYTVFVKSTGFVSDTKTFKLVQTECPYECCLEDSGYTIKTCELGYECKENKCVAIEENKLYVKCLPINPRPRATITCSLYDKDNTFLNKDATATLTYGGMSKTLLFTDGSVNFSIDIPTEYTINVPDIEGYKGNTWTDTVEVPKIHFGKWWKWVIVIGVILLLLLFLIFKIKKKRFIKVGYGPSELEFDEIYPT